MMLRLGSALMLLSAVMFPAATAAQGRTTYCCTDDGGKQTCSDVLPKQCYGRAYREINAQGVTTKRIDAPLTAEQRAQKEAEAKKVKEEEAKRLEQDRKNRALLATYATEQDIDYVRDRTVADIEKAIKGLQEKQAELAKRKQQLDAEAEFYKKKPMPPQLQTQKRDNDTEMKSLQTAIEGRQKEIGTVKARYDEEKLRYRELTKKKAASGTGATAQVPTAGAESRPR
jgi:NACalpha-BTF3-like transcription factor